MKYAIINTGYEYGSTGSMTKELYKHFSGKGNEVMVFYGRGDDVDDVNVIKIDSKIEVYIHVLLARLLGLQGYFSNRATRKLIKHLDIFKPDVVVLLNIHGYYLNEKKVITYLKENDIRTVYIMPDEYPFLGACCFSKECSEFKKECRICQKGSDYPKSLFFSQSNRIFRRKKKMYEGFDKVIFAAPKYSIMKAKESTLLKDKQLEEIDWGINNKNLYCYRDYEEVCKKYAIPSDKKVILTVAPFNDERKGIKKYFYPCVQNIKRDDVCFVNVGYNGSEKELPNNFIPISYMHDQEELAALYSRADVFVTTSTSDTMPLTCLISLSCGTPVICFDISGLSFLFYDNYCGKKLKKIDVEELAKTLENIEYNNMFKRNQIIEYARNRYSNETFLRKIDSFVEKLL